MAQGTVIQGSFRNGPRIPAPPAPAPPRAPVPHAVQLQSMRPGAPAPHTAPPLAGSPRIPPPPPARPGAAVPPPVHSHQARHGAPPPHVAQRQAVPTPPGRRDAPPPLVHQPRVTQPHVAQPRGGQPVVQRMGKGEAFQLPANLSSFGGVGGQPLPVPVRQKMESFFNTSFADVRVHVGAQAPAIGALAFTHGSNLYFAPGQYNPNTVQGQQLLGHELTHVVQQRAGRVRNPFGSGVAVVQDREMEAEAERMGLQAASHRGPVQAKMASPVRQPMAGRGAPALTAGGVAQPMTWTEMIGMGIGAVVGGVGATALIGGTLPVLAGIAGMGAVGKVLGQEARRYFDPFRSIAIGEDESLEDIKADVDSAMGKIKLYIQDKVGESLKKKGRDHVFYALTSPLENLDGLVKSWNKGWDVASTAGLLLDLQSAVKNIEELHKKVPNDGGLSEEQRFIRKHGYNASPPGYDESPSGKKTKPLGPEIKSHYDVQANPSATTANLLTFLRTIATPAGITKLEIEAIMQAVIMFWEKRPKRYTGDYHTPVEVWMAYTRHLELDAKKND